MQMVMNPAAARICLLAGGAVFAAFLFRSLRKQGAGTGKCLLLLPVPLLLGLLAARGGYALLQAEEVSADIGWSFRWCYTAGLLGLALGTGLSARIAGCGMWKTLDGCAAGLCLCMACARLSQRWLGETGMGPILDGTGLFAMVNDWDEPVLAVWLIEALVCLAAAGIVLYAQGRKPQTAGGNLCLAVFLMLIPWILTEQFRSGAYLRFMMMRLEQALFALVCLAALLFLCGKVRRGRKEHPGRAYLPAVVFLTLAGVIALAQFLLDDKLISVPTPVSWTLYGLALAGMLRTCVRTVRKADSADQRKEPAEE